MTIRMFRLPAGIACDDLALEALNEDHGRVLEISNEGEGTIVRIPSEIAGEQSFGKAGKDGWTVGDDIAIHLFDMCFVEYLPEAAP